MCWDQHLTSTIQFLCISSIPETLLHVTLKRRAEISADIFTCLLRYFPPVLQEFDNNIYLLTGHPVRTEKYEARSHIVRTERSEAPHTLARLVKILNS